MLTTNRRLSKILVVMSVLALGACASQGDVQKAQSTADQALQQAQAANQAAQAASRQAQEASQQAQQAQAAAGRTYQNSLRK
jgi:coenzyme F420-reducing hydrogenase gamma subunit